MNIKAYLCVLKLNNKNMKKKNGQQTQDFFSNVTNGNFGKSEKSYVINNSALSVDGVNNANDILILGGNFDNHIFKSIPTYFENLVNKANVLSKLSNVKILDLGASDNLLLRAVNMLTVNKMDLVALDCNNDMYVNSLNKPFATDYICEPFIYDFDNVKAHDFGDEKFDIVNASMFFQFINNDRAFQIAETKKVLKSDGVFIIDEKCFDLTNDWKENELLKDEYKKQYFTVAEMDVKKEEVLVGMHQDMISFNNLKSILKANFKYVKCYWTANNFHGFVCSDSEENVNKFFPEYFNN